MAVPWIPASAGAVLIAAQAAPSTEDLPGLPPIAQYGLLGLFVLAAFARKIVFGWQYDILEKENEALKADNKDLVRLNFETQQQVLPALEASSRALEEASFLLERRRRGDRDARKDERDG